MNIARSIRSRAHQLSRHVRRVLTENLSAQQVAGAEHERKLAEEEEARKEAEQDFVLVLQEAVKGAENLIKACQDPAMQKAAALYQKVNHEELTIFNWHMFRQDGYVFWSSACWLYMKSGHLYLWVDQGLDSNHDERQYTLCLTDLTRSTPDGEEVLILEKELWEVAGLYRGREDGWLVEATLSIDVLLLEEDKECESAPFFHGWDKLYMTWMAFLVACADEKKLAKLIDRAFKKATAKTA